MSKPNKKKQPIRPEDIPYGGNYIRLSLLELAFVIPLTLILAFRVFPSMYAKSEKFDFDSVANFRLKSDMRDNYWAYERWAAHAAENYEVIFIGDSVIWGMYADNDSTLPAFYNQLRGGKVAANLGIDGLHPVAMERLLRSFGAPIQNKKVYLYFNALWMNDPKYDLSGLLQRDRNGDLESFTPMHPRLLPQFDRSIHVYNENMRRRIGNVLEQQIPMYSLLNHIRGVWYENKPLPAWMTDNPDRLNPFSAIGSVVSAAEVERLTRNVAWNSGMTVDTAFNWVMPYQSRQWEAFKSVCELLAERGNEVTVIAGVFNTYMLTNENAKVYERLLSIVEDELDELGIKYILLDDVVGEDEFGDASHPLVAGYEAMAETIIDEE